MGICAPCCQWFAGLVVLGMTDFAALLYGPIYSTLGVAAVLDLGSDGQVTLTVIDKTAGADVGGDGLDVHSIKPAADVRVTELNDNDLERDDLNGKAITFNGSTWTVITHLIKPGPQGETSGEIRMVLSA